MSTWRPLPQIRVKALGLHWRDGRLLAGEVYGDGGQVKGVRPLGGSVEFGEHAEAAVKREFKEELGVEVQVLSGPMIMENLYSHEGVAGHEVLFLFEVGFSTSGFVNLEHIIFHEDDGEVSVAKWYDLNDLDDESGLALYPKGLKQLLLDFSRA